MLLASVILSWILLCLYRWRDDHDWLNTVWCVLLLVTQVLILLFNGMKTAEYDHVRAFTALGFSWDSIKHFLLVFSVSLFIIGSVYWSVLIFMRDSGVEAPMLLAAPPLTVLGIYATFIILAIFLKASKVQGVAEVVAQVILGLYGLVTIAQVVHVVIQTRREFFRCILLGVYTLITMIFLLYACYVILSMGIMFLCLAFGVLLLFGGALNAVKSSGSMSADYKIIRHVGSDGKVKVMRMPKSQNTDGFGSEI